MQQFEPTRDQKIAYIWDAYKDAYGMRPRGVYDFDSMSDEDLDAEADRLSEAVGESIKREEEEAQRCVDAFKQMVQNTIDLGAGDYPTALRWISQNVKFYNSQDVEHFVWNQGILFTDYGRQLVKDLAGIVEYVNYEEEEYDPAL